MLKKGTKHLKERDNFCLGKASVSGFSCFYHQLNVSLSQSSSLKLLIVNICWWPPNAGIQPTCSWPWLSIPSLIYPTLHLPSYHLQQPSGPGCLDINPSTSMCSKLNLLLFIFLTIKLIISLFKSEILFLSLVLPSHSFSISNVSRISYFCLHNCLHLTFPLCGRCLYHHFTR